MFKLWKKCRPSGEKRTDDDTYINPNMLETQAVSCPVKDTIKLVEPSAEDDVVPPRVEAKPLENNPSVFIMHVDDGLDKLTRKLSICSDSDLLEEKDSQKNHRRASISGVQWADLPKDSERELRVPLGTSSEADVEDGFPKSSGTGSRDRRPLGNSPPPIISVWSIPEEADDSGKDKNTPVNMSSADTDECDTDSTQNKRKGKSLSKQENFNSLTTSFPGLRKDSIDMYKKKRQNQSPGPSQGQGSAGTGSQDPNPVDPNGPIHRPPTTDLPPASPSILKKQYSDSIIDKEVRQSVFTILSGMYAMFLTILGAVLPIAEVFAPQKHPLLFEIFYIYMYGGSIIFLGYVYTYLLRTRAAQKTDNPLQKRKRRKRKVSVDQVGSHTGSFYLRLGAVAFGIGSMIHSGLQFGDYFEVEAFDPCAHAVFALRPVVHLIFTFVQLYFVFMNSKMCINKYKVIARFGLMHMVATNICVWFNTIVEETLHQLGAQESTAHHVLAENLLSHDHPVGVQNHSLLAGGQRSVSGPGHAHGVTGVHEVVTTLTTTLGHIIGPHLHHQNVTHEGDGHPFPIPYATTPETPYTCKTSQLMMTVLETVGPYLYPCSIEYSLICAGIIYTLWKNIGKRVMSIKSEDGSDDRSQVQRLRVDCSHSSRGLFLGILVLVGTIITMVVFFVLVKTPTHNKSAMFVEYLSEIALFAVSSVAVLIAATRMRYLRFNSAQDTDFEEVLILISLSGDYMFQMLSLVAAIFDGEQFASRLSITASLLGIIQSTLQTMFVLDALRRSSKNTKQSKQKNGRECVTFLLISNIAMWCINTFEAERTVANPVQMHYYGALAWSILTHISIPLGIFFRFHSTVCLSNIWKRAWKSYP